MRGWGNPKPRVLRDLAINAYRWDSHSDAVPYAPHRESHASATLLAFGAAVEPTVVSASKHINPTNEENYMDQSLLLRRLIAMGLAGAGALAAESAFASCGERGRLACDEEPRREEPVVVIARPDPYEAENPCYGGDCDQDPPDDTSPDGDNGGDDSGGDETNAFVCLQLNAMGRPRNCNQQVAFGGVPAPDLRPDGYDELASPTAPMDYWIATVGAGASAELAACYADRRVEEAQCERLYLSAWQTLEPMSRRWADPYQETFQGLLQDIRSWQAGAIANRSYAGLFGSSGWDSTYNFYNFGVQIGGAGQYILTDPFNTALIKAREQRLCELWFRAMEDNGCNF